MKFIHNAIEYNIMNCEHDYTTNIMLNMKRLQADDNSLSWYDYTSTYDWRETLMTWKLNNIHSNTVIDLFNEVSKARLDTVSLELNGTDWLYPFGPDLGNEDTFTMDCIGTESGPMLISPWRYFDFSATFRMISKPLYSIGIEQSQGDVQVGTITNLSYPTVDLDTQRNLVVNKTSDGIVNKVDGLEKYDYNVATLTFSLRLEKAGKLINYLTQTARGSTFNIITNSNNWLFGSEGGTSGTYAVKLNSNIISVVHRKPRRFDVSFSVYREQI